MPVKEASVGRKLWLDEKGNEHWTYEAQLIPVIREGDDPMEVLNAADLVVEKFLYKRIGKEPPIRANLKPSGEYEPVQLPKPSEMPMLTKTGRIMEALGPDLCEELDIDDSGSIIKIKAKQFWFGDEGKERWRRVNTILESLFGTVWIKTEPSKDSHWETPK